MCRPVAQPSGRSYSTCSLCADFVVIRGRKGLASSVFLRGAVDTMDDLGGLYNGDLDYINKKYVAPEEEKKRQAEQEAREKAEEEERQRRLQVELERVKREEERRKKVEEAQKKRREEEAIAREEFEIEKKKKIAELQQVLDEVIETEKQALDQKAKFEGKKKAKMYELEFEEKSIRDPLQALAERRKRLEFEEAEAKKKLASFERQKERDLANLDQEEYEVNAKASEAGTRKNALMAMQKRENEKKYIPPKYNGDMHLYDI